jgi:hypothetical protein
MKIKEILNQAQITPLIVHKGASFTQLVSLLCKYNEIRDIFVVTDSNKFLVYAILSVNIIITFFLYP